MEIPQSLRDSDLPEIRAAIKRLESAEADLSAGRMTRLEYDDLVDGLARLDGIETAAEDQERIIVINQAISALVAIAKAAR